MTIALRHTLIIVWKDVFPAFNNFERFSFGSCIKFRKVYKYLLLKPVRKVAFLRWLFCQTAHFWSRKEDNTRPLFQNKYWNSIFRPLFVHFNKIAIALDTSFNFFSVFSDMMAFHKPKMYKSMNGCCICKAKSSRYKKTDIDFNFHLWKFLFILQSRFNEEKTVYFLVLAPGLHWVANTRRTSKSVSVC